MTTTERRSHVLQIGKKSLVKADNRQNRHFRSPPGSHASTPCKTLEFLASDGVGN
jgi:hypothetical protein